MKIGRNEPCPCGSGKKYKKCCLLTKTQAPTVSAPFAGETDFSYIIPNAERLYERIKDYAFQDLIVATFCLNLWRRNRSALAQALTLHLALSKDKPFGNLSIKGYSDFKSFFSKISEFAGKGHRFLRREIFRTYPHPFNYALLLQGITSARSADVPCNHQYHYV